MKTVVLITARLGSTRLSRKHLLEINGKPIIQYLVDFINITFEQQIKDGSVEVVIATSEKEENKDFENRITNCKIFYGSDANIPLRHLQAAREYNAVNVLSVDGDDILCSRNAMKQVVSSLNENNEFVKTEGLPLGMNASGYSKKCLERVISNYTNEKILETGWGRIFEGVQSKIIKFEFESLPDLRFTLDYDEDFIFFSKLFENTRIANGWADDIEIIEEVKTRKLYAITLPLVEEYWRNFNANMKNEQEKKEYL